MKRALIKNLVLKVLFTACICFLMCHYTSLISYADESETVYSVVPDDAKKVIDEVYLSPNNFGIVHIPGKEENLQHLTIYSLQTEKLLWDSIFDHDHNTILGQTLAWYTHSAYYYSLSPLWRPSIPIAHRKLII